MNQQNRTYTLGLACGCVVAYDPATGRTGPVTLACRRHHRRGTAWRAGDWLFAGVVLVLVTVLVILEVTR
jgi:hypothetical protein